MLEWKKRYSVEISRIDLQHRKVFAIIRRLSSMLDRAQDDWEMEGLLQELHDYLQTHFRDEETMMLRCNYPGYEEQKREHDSFVVLLGDHQRAFVKNRPALSAGLFNSLWDRFARHIEELDKKYVPYFRSRGLA